MNFIEIVCLIFIVQISSFFMFILGSEYKENGVKIKNPIEEVKSEIHNKKVKKETNKSIETMNTILQNIDSYDGTNKNQKEVK
nr:MAG TPA: hypothetical protein [Caudoviricetes sp.]